MQLDATLRYVDDLPHQQVPSYVLFDARLAWHPTDRLELAVVGQNLPADQHPEFGLPATRKEIQYGGFGKITYSW